MASLSTMISPRMRCYGLLSAVWLLLASANAETIHLKNGRTILADSVREVNGRVEYTIGENTFALPKSSVLSIDTGGSPVVTRAEEIPAAPAPPRLTVTGADELAARLVVNGKVEVEVLNSVEREGNAEKSAFAYSLAARHEVSSGSMDQAVRYMERANAVLPNNASLITGYSNLLVRVGRFKEAEPLAERATRIAPDLASAFAVLGYAEFQLSKTKESIRALKRSLELQADPVVEDLLKKAQRELSAEGDFSQENSSHFTMRYEGGQAPAALRRDILQTLERHYDDLTRDLGFAPHESITVVLYSDKQFFDVTQAPTWTGALNDGKLRMPINGLTGMTSEFSRVLKHELTHSFINEISKGRCPTWLNEGVAQLEEPRSAVPMGTRLAALYGSQHNIPLNQLEASFVRFSGPEANVAYAQSLAAVEYIRDTYGMADVAGILRRLGEGQSTESALRSTIHSGYGQLEQELTSYLKRQYGD